jgi:Integrase core domain
MKHSNVGRGEPGVSRIALYPRHSWMLDICSGLPSVNGYWSYLTMVDVFTGYVVCSALKNETSANIADVIENDLIKPFGPPVSISSDNARNLSVPEVQNLYKFYKIRQHLTTPYSPESHGLVENQNRYVTQLLRVFAEQFRTTWYHCLPLAVITVNNVPRDSLKDHSPAFFMFGREFYEESPNVEKLLDFENYTTTLKNNQIFFRLLREYLLVQRKKKNVRCSDKTISIPKGTLVYIKDFSKVPCKKAKAVYLKAPEKVISEYAQCIYTLDFLGKVHRRAKYNVKKASNRSIRLFGKLPLRIKMVLGGPLTPDIWDSIKDQKNLPEYMEYVDNVDDKHQPIRTRQYLPNDSHILEKSADVVKEYEPPSNVDVTGETFDHLKFLHDNNALVDPNMSLEDIEPLYRKLRRNPEKIQQQVASPDAAPAPDPLYSTQLGEGAIVDIVNDQPKRRQRILDGILPENILKERTRKRVAINPEPETRYYLPDKN